MSHLSNSPGLPFTLKAVVFDLDGTLLHSAPDLRVAANRLLREEGQPELPLETVERMVGEGVGRLVERLFGAFDIVLSPRSLDAYTMRFRELYLEQPVGLSELYPGALPVLDALQDADVPLAICTNKPERHTAVILDHFGLAERFVAVVCGDTLPVRKPDPAPLNHAVGAVGAASTATLFVGDSATDAATGLAAGVPTALVAGGYTSEPIASMPAQFYLDRISDVSDLVLGPLRSTVA